MPSGRHNVGAHERRPPSAQLPGQRTLHHRPHTLHSERVGPKSASTAYRCCQKQWGSALCGRPRQHPAREDAPQGRLYYNFRRRTLPHCPHRRSAPSDFRSHSLHFLRLQHSCSHQEYGPPKRTLQSPSKHRAPASRVSQNWLTILPGQKGVGRWACPIVHQSACYCGGA